MRYRKRQLRVLVSFAKIHGVLNTLEGRIVFQPGDGIVTAQTGESWVVSKAQFHQKYEPDHGVLPWADGMYWKRAEFVFATRQTDRFQVVIDGGILVGNCGDWLIEDENGSKWIVSDAFFNNSYDPIATA